MRRRHLIEIHEQPWCPAAVRAGATDVLRLIAVIGRQFDGIGQPLQRALALTGDRYVVDLGAGAGGPWLGLYRRLDPEQVQPIVVLTDLFPHVEAMAAARQRSGGRIQFVPRPVDMTDVPADLPGFRTLFTAFHHFRPATARAILQDAVDAGQGIAVFEQTQRSLFAMLFMGILAPIALLGMPLVRPWRWSRFFWTYLIPAVPLVLLWDGVVSCLRTYTRAELQEMVASLDGAPYAWQYGRARTPLSPLGTTYLIGYPNNRAQAPLPYGAGSGPRVARTR